MVALPAVAEPKNLSWLRFSVRRAAPRLTELTTEIEDESETMVALPAVADSPNSSWLWFSVRLAVPRLAEPITFIRADLSKIMLVLSAVALSANDTEPPRFKMLPGPATLEPWNLTDPPALFSITALPELPPPEN